MDGGCGIICVILTGELDLDFFFAGKISAEDYGRVVGCYLLAQMRNL